MKRVPFLAVSMRIAFGVCALLYVVGTSLPAAQTSMLTIEVIDPNPALLSPEGSVLAADTPEAVDLLAGAHPIRVGVVADGVSQLLVRVRASNAVTFSVSGRFGHLRELGDEAQSRSVTVQPSAGTDGTWWAFALYTPPDQVPGGRTFRTFGIVAREEARTGSVTLRLESPPVLLVHGLWSNGSAWDGLREFLRDRHYTLCESDACTIDYGSVQPAPSFDPFAGEPEEQFAVNHLIAATAAAVESLRQAGIAATQVDVVAHSLGGLLARARVALPDEPRAYRRRVNFHRGDFHKLITVGTPHLGTPVADFLIDNRDVRSSFLDNRTLEEYFASIGRPFGDAVEQLRTHSSALENIGATLVPSHSIVGIAPRRSRTEDLLNTLPRALGYSLTLDDLLTGDRNHDTIVPVNSQAGGLPRGAVTRVRNTVHADVDARDTSETESKRIWRRIVQLLRASSASGRFANYPAGTNAVPVSEAVSDW